MKTVTLKKGEILKPTTDCWIEVSDGNLWLTYENDLKDYVLISGQRFHVNGKSPVIQALAETSLSVDDSLMVIAS